jgi:hypothetical protein
LLVYESLSTHHIAPDCAFAKGLFYHLIYLYSLVDNQTTPSSSKPPGRQ